MHFDFNMRHYYILQIFLILRLGIMICKFLHILPVAPDRRVIWY
jgi:hypothetical protein